MAQIARKLGCSESHVHRYLRVAKQAPPALKVLLQERKIAMHLASTFLDYQQTLPVERHERVLRRAVDEKMSAAEFERFLSRVNGGPKPKTSAEPIRVLKRGGFVLSQLRFDESSEDLDERVELLRKALKRARALQRKRDNAAKAEREASK